MIFRNFFFGRKILIVDDNNVNFRVVAGVLKKYGVDVVCVESGVKVVLLFKLLYEFDVCFMDI